VKHDSLDLYSPLPPAQCVQRLGEAIDPERWPLLRSGSWLGSRPVLGRVGNTSLRLRKRIRYNNGFQTYLMATIEPCGPGARIYGKFDVHYSTRWFYRVWTAFVLFFAAMVSISALSRLRSPASHPEIDGMILLVPFLVLAFVWGVIRLGRYLARDEAEFLAAFIREHLHATDHPGGP